MFTRMYQLAAPFLALAIALVLAAPAQAVTTEEAERLLKQDIDRREQEQRERRWQELHAPAAPAPAVPAPAPTTEPALPPEETPGAAAGPCFPIHEIQIQPADILSARRVQTIIRPYRGRCLHAGDLTALQKALNAQAVAEGLVTTRVVVPEQNLASGTLHFEVWPGRVEAVRAPALGTRELALASPLRVGDLLNLRALEQTVDNLNRLASQKATVELLPGEKPGSSIADFTVVRKAPWQAGLSWQGEAQNADESSHTLRASATLDSPLNLSDRLILGLNANLKDQQVDNAWGGSFDYDLPMGWWRFSVGADRFDYGNPIVAGVTTFISSGESRTWRAEISRLLHRDARRRVNLALHGKQRLSDNFIDGVTVGVSTTRVSALGLRADFSRVAAPWVWDVTLDAEGGTGRSPALISPVDSRYSRVLASTRLQYHLASASFSGSVNGQWSDARLAPGEQFTLTGQVPGFTPQVLNAGTGIAAQLEAAFPRQLPKQLHDVGLTSVRPSVGFAWALAPRAGGNTAEEYVAAFKTGVTAPWQQAVMNIAVAFPVEKFSSINVVDDWQLNAGFSVQW